MNLERMLLAFREDERIAEGLGMGDPVTNPRLVGMVSGVV